MNIKNILFGTIILIIGFGAGFYFSHSISNPDTNNNRVNAAYRLGWDSARKNLEDRGILSVNGNTNFYKNILNGSIKGIKDNVLNVEVIPYEILPNPEMDIREITITDKTLIHKTVKIPDDEYKKAVEEYYIKHPEYKNSPFFADDYPSMFSDVSATKNDLNVGQKLTIKADEEIYNKKEFAATEISILYID